MIQFLTIPIVISEIILTFVVLIQNSKGGGLAAGFSSANQVFGVKKTTDRIEKLTWTLIAIIVVLSIFSARMISSRASTSNTTSQVDIEQAQTQQQATTPVESQQPQQTAPEEQPIQPAN